MKSLLSGLFLVLTFIFGSSHAIATPSQTNTFVIARKHAPAEKPAKAEAQEEKVWVNTKSGVYHNSSCRYYGNTKSGTYMTRTEAEAQGRACGKCGG